MKWETVIGLEVHIELSTHSKIFCTCASSFGAEPNTHCCPICLGLPGAIPNLNREVLRYAVLACLAFKCTIQTKVLFDRKNYFYPDLPKAYQITQYREPIGQDGVFELESGKQIHIAEIHMEEDAGKLLHTEKETICDYNRCGIPLLEIVTSPDFRSSDEVYLFLSSVQKLFRYLGISDGKIHEGSMRADVNVSVHHSGSAYGQRVEIKNISSFQSISEAKVTFSMRSKERAQDYRYFPEPDIPMIHLENDWLAEIEQSMPELPSEKYERYIQVLQLSPAVSKILTDDPDIALFFENIVNLGISSTIAAKWITRDIFMYLNRNHLSMRDLKLSAASFCELIQLTESGKINRQTAADILALLCQKDFSVIQYIKENHLWQTTDDRKVGCIVDKIMKEQKKAVQDYMNGKQKVLGFFVGQYMKESKGQGNPEKFIQILDEKLAEIKKGEH